MATISHITTIPTQQSPGAEVLTSPGRFHLGCRTAADVQVRATRVRAFRAQVFKPEPQPAAPPPPSPAPATPAPVITPPAQTEPVPAVPGRISVRQVIETTAAHFGTTVDDLVSDTRKQPIVRRRQLAMYVAHKLTGRSLPFIARKMGRKDHTTVLHAHRLIKRLLEAGDAATIAAVDGITEQLQATGGANV
jgi:hypothetical protein